MPECPSCGSHSCPYCMHGFPLRCHILWRVSAPKGLSSDSYTLRGKPAPFMLSGALPLLDTLRAMYGQPRASCSPIRSTNMGSRARRACLTLQRPELFGQHTVNVRLLFWSHREVSANKRVHVGVCEFIRGCCPLGALGREPIHGPCAVLNVATLLAPREARANTVLPPRGNRPTACVFQVFPVWRDGGSDQRIDILQGHPSRGRHPRLKTEPYIQLVHHRRILSRSQYASTRNVPWGFLLRRG